MQKKKKAVAHDFRYDPSTLQSRLLGVFSLERKKIFCAHSPPPHWGFHHVPAAEVVWIFRGSNVFELTLKFHVTSKLSLNKSSYNAVILEVLLSTKDQNRPKSRHFSLRHNSVGAARNLPPDIMLLS